MLHHSINYITSTNHIQWYTSVHIFPNQFFSTFRICLTMNCRLWSLLWGLSPFLPLIGLWSPPMRIPFKGNPQRSIRLGFPLRGCLKRQPLLFNWLWYDVIIKIHLHRLNSGVLLRLGNFLWKSEMQVLLFWQ